MRQLATYANQDGLCWPTIETVATDTGMSRRAVQAAVRFLEWLGLIGRTRRRRTQGGWRTTLTTISRKPREWVEQMKPRAGHRPHVDQKRAARAEIARKNVQAMLLAQAHSGAHRTPHGISDLYRLAQQTPARGEGPTDLRTLSIVATIQQIRRSHIDAGNMQRNSANRRRKG